MKSIHIDREALFWFDINGGKAGIFYKAGRSILQIIVNQTVLVLKVLTFPADGAIGQ